MLWCSGQAEGRRHGVEEVRKVPGTNVYCTHIPCACWCSASLRVVCLPRACTSSRYRPGGSASLWSSVAIMSGHQVDAGRVRAFDIFRFNTPRQLAAAVGCGGILRLWAAVVCCSGMLLRYAAAVKLRLCTTDVCYGSIRRLQHYRSLQRCPPVPRRYLCSS